MSYFIFFIRKYYRGILLSFCVVLAEVVCLSCANENEPDVMLGEVPVSLMADLGNPFTRVTETGWSDNDRVGVFMVKKGEDFYENYGTIPFRMYKPTKAGDTLVSIDENDPLYYPVDGSEVYFIAFAPCTSKPVLDRYCNPVCIPIVHYSYDLSKQGSGVAATDSMEMEAIDHIWCKTDLKNQYYSKSNPQANLAFTHQLSKIVINVTAGTGITDLTSLNKVKIEYEFKKYVSEIYTGKIFEPGTGATSNGSISFYKSATESNNVTFEGILCPTFAGSNTTRKVYFTFGEKTYGHPLTKSYKSGYKYVYNFTLTQSGVTLNSNAHTPWGETDVVNDTIKI